MKKIRYAWLALLIAGIFALASACAPAAAKKEMKEEKKMEEKKEEAKPAAEEVEKVWKSDADGVLEDGVLTRTNAPAFTMEIPGGLNPGKFEGPNEIWRGTQDVVPWTVIVSIFDLPEGGIEAAGKTDAENWITWAKSINSKKMEILSVQPIDTYDEFPAVQVEVEYLHTDGATMLTILNHLIEKEGKVIHLGSWMMGDPEQVTSIYEKIDLDP